MKAQVAFNKIKDIILSKLVLIIFNPNKKTELEINISDFGLRA